MTARKLCLHVHAGISGRGPLYAYRAPGHSGRRHSSSFLFFGILGMVPPSYKNPPDFSRNSRNGRIADFSVSCFGAIFRGNSGRRAAPKSPVVLRAGQTMPREIVVFRYRFGVHFAGSPLLSFLPPSFGGVSLPLVRSLRSGFLHFPAGSRCATSPGSISHTGRSFDWNNPSMNYLYHRTFLCPVPYVHKIGIKGKNQKFPRLRKV